MPVDLSLFDQPIPGIKPSKLLSKKLCNQLQQHAQDEYPKECIGYVKDKKYYKLENVSNDPENNVALSPDSLAHLMEAEPDVICHSHPDGPDCPSQNDMIFQRQTACAHAIVSTNGTGSLQPFVYGDMVAREPLLGRGARYGVQDCYAAIRDYYLMTRDIVLKDFPRDWEWWDAQKNNGTGMYIDHFREAGFERVDPSDAQEGDVILMRAASPVVNHGGIYLGDGLMYHHLMGRLPADASRLASIEPIVRWQAADRVDQIIRYTG